LWVAAAVLAAVAVWPVILLPPAPLSLPADPADNDGTTPGVLHVHSNRSDGRGSPDEVAAIAARAGLKFVVFSDHGDGTRAPDPPAYRSGVLCLDGTEISTTGGHYLAFDMPASPYPLGGEPWSVVEDVRRLGGVGIAAHPDSPKSELRWADWSAPIDGVEAMNPDTSWRVHLHDPRAASKLRLARALLTYPLRPAESIGGLMASSSLLREHGAALWRRRRVIVTAGVDAHAKLELRDGDPGDNRFSLPLPSYQASFRTLTTRVRLDRRLTGDAAADARLLTTAIRNGALYSVVDAFATPPFFDFTAEHALGTVTQGGEVVGGGPVTLRVRSNAPPTFVTTIYRDDAVLDARAGGGEMAVAAPGGAAVYRVEITAADRSFQPAWLISNPIYVRDGSAGETSATVEPPVLASRFLYDGTDGGLWSSEADPSSRAALDSVFADGGRSQLLFRFGLAGGAPVHQYAAVVASTQGGVDGFDRITFTARAERPMRISVQLRVSVPGAPDERWHRSVYLDPAERSQTVRFGDMTAIGHTRAPRPPLSEVHSAVFAVELTNTKPGSSGRIWITSAALERSSATVPTVRF
jgi:hypothetical protein